MKKEVAIIFVISIVILSSYIVSSSTPGEVDSCQTLNVAGVYTLNKSITYNGSCFSIASNNVTLNGAGYTLTGNDSGIGVYVYGYNNTVIRNFKNITDNYYGIVIERSHNNTAYNLSTYSSSNTGIYLANAHSNRVSNTTSISDYFGVYIKENSNSNNFTNITTSLNYRGIEVSGSINNKMNNVISIDDDYSTYFESRSDNNSLNNLTSTKARYGGINVERSHNNNFSNLNISDLDAGGSGIFIYYSNKTSVHNSHVYNASYAIYAFYSNNLTIQSANLVGISGVSYYGIIAQYSDSSNMIQNNASGYYSGIYAYEVSNSTMLNNTLYNNSAGLDFSVSGFNTLKWNSIYNNSVNFNFVGGEAYFNNTIDTTNTINGQYKIYFNFSLNNYVFNPTSAPQAAIIVCARCSNITIENLNLSQRNKYGVYVLNTSNSTIRNITASNNDFGGITLDYSNNNDVTNSSLFFNPTNGILVSGNSTNNRLYNNTVIGSGYAIRITDTSNNNTITSSQINGNYNGLGVAQNAYKNNFYNNTLHNNSNGIQLSTNAHDNNFSGGIINDSLYSGIFMIKFFFDIGPVNNTFSNIPIYNTNTSAYDLNFEFGSVNGTTLIDMPHIGKYKFEETNSLTFINTNYGKIKFLGSLTGTGSNLSQNIILEDNTALLIGGNSGVNSPAEVTLYNIGNRGFTNASILREGELCTGCLALTSLTATDVTFNIPGAARYSIGDYLSSSSSESSSSGSVTFKPTEDELAKGYTRIMYKNWKVEFSINGEQHKFTVENMSNKGVGISVYSERQDASITEGKEKKFDLDNNGYYDFLVSINTIEGSSAKITLKTISESLAEKVSVSNSQAQEDTQGESEIAREKRSIIIPIILISAAIAIILSIILYRRRLRRYF